MWNGGERGRKKGMEGKERREEERRGGRGVRRPQYVNRSDVTAGA